MVTLHGGPVVLRPVRATPCFSRISAFVVTKLRQSYPWPRDEVI